MPVSLRPALATFLVGCATAPRPAAAPAAREASPVAETTVSATDARIRVMGRHVVVDDAVEFAASGVTFYMRFRGTALAVDLDEQSRDSTAHNWFTVVVDGRDPVRIRTDARTRRYTLAAGLPTGEHTLALSKATEGQNGHERLVAVHTTELLAAPPLPARRIEFVGNSITAGYGSDPRPVACHQGTWYDATHAWLAYGPRVARRVGAQWMLSAVSGIGANRNYSAGAPTMPRVYGGVYMEYADTASTWDFTRYAPDLVTVALGTNDFSDGPGPTPRPALDADAFVRDYERLVTMVRDRYPRARLLLLDSPMLAGERRRLQREYLRRVVADRRAAGDSAVSQFSFDGHYVAGCDGHPALAEQARMAEELEPAVRRLMGW